MTESITSLDSLTTFFINLTFIESVYCATRETIFFFQLGGQKMDFLPRTGQ